MIEVKELTKRFEEITALDHVNATIREGSVFGLIGTNGREKYLSEAGCRDFKARFRRIAPGRRQSVRTPGKKECILLYFR